MRLALLISLLAAVAAQNNNAICFPPACLIDDNCVDNVHSGLGNAKCCGGVCRLPPFPTGRVIGEECTPSGINGYESCAGTCAPGLYCNPDVSRCYALQGYNCNCTLNADCLSNTCRPAVNIGDQRLCAGQNLPNGQVCAYSTECRSNSCVGNMCVGLAQGATCFIGGARCNTDLGLICRANVCMPRCATGEANCCSSREDCVIAHGMRCAIPTGFSTGTCAVALAAVPGLDEPCPKGICAADLICEVVCNVTYGCSGENFCQRRHSLPIGHYCSRTAQCPQNTTCLYQSSSARSICQTFVAPGEVCATSGTIDQYTYSRCLPPANMCLYNGASYVCKQSNMTALGAPCSLDTSYLGRDECIFPNTCVTTFSSLMGSCTAPLPVGATCSANTNPRCQGEGQNCVGYYYPKTTSLYYYYTCVAPHSVEDGKACNATRQCMETSTCLSNGTCASIIGRDCDHETDCGNTYTYDCSCGRKCYLLNPPTPYVAPPYVAPPASCDSKLAAWKALDLPVSYPFETNVYPYEITQVTYDTFDTESEISFVAMALQLSAQDREVMIDVACCYTCRENKRFNAHLTFGYQVDCEKRTLIKLDNTCNNLRNTPAFLNCWTAMSSAPALSIGVGAFLIAAAVLY